MTQEEIITDLKELMERLLEAERRKGTVPMMYFFREIRERISDHGIDSEIFGDDYKEFKERAFREKVGVEITYLKKRFDNLSMIDSAEKSIREAEAEGVELPDLKEEVVKIKKLALACIFMEKLKELEKKGITYFRLWEAENILSLIRASGLEFANLESKFSSLKGEPVNAGLGVL